MRQAPLTFKLIINFVAYIGYTIFLSIIFSFAFPFVLKLMWKELYNPTDPIFTKIQITIAVVVLVITLIFRKYFYLSLRKYNDIPEEIVEEKKELEKDWLNFDMKTENTEPKKTPKKESEYIFKMDDEEDEEDNDNLKIFVDKEIKR